MAEEKIDHRAEAERIAKDRAHAHGDSAAMGILHAVLALIERIDSLVDGDA